MLVYVATLVRESSMDSVEEAFEQAIEPLVFVARTAEAARAAAEKELILELQEECDEWVKEHGPYELPQPTRSTLSRGERFDWYLEDVCDTATITVQEETLRS